MQQITFVNTKAYIKRTYKVPNGEGDTDKLEVEFKTESGEIVEQSIVDFNSNQVGESISIIYNKAHPEEIYHSNRKGIYDAWDTPLVFSIGLFIYIVYWIYDYNFIGKKSDLKW